MLRKSLFELIYQGAHIQRWNDHMRPKGFTELDKQSQKMIISFLIAKSEENDRGIDIDWRGLIEGGIFEYLHRIVLTDIKPPIFYKLMSEHGEKLNKWVLEKLKDDLTDINDDFYEKFNKYLFDNKYCSYEKRILRAAHYLATNWEFQIIYHLNSNIYGIEETKESIENEIEEYYDLSAVRKIGLRKKTSNFIDLVGQLRFQQRWAQSPRIPETSVMGHMLIVAIMAYFCSIEINACDRRIYNNFFGALFHDLPEVLTRDIISPVKQSIPALDDLIKDIEKRQVEEKLLPLLPPYLHKEIKFYIEEEFKSRIIKDNKIEIVTSDEISEKYNSDEYSPIDGEILRCCDHLAAYLEAQLSIIYGISSPHLREGADSIYNMYKSKKIAGLNFGQYFDYFKTK